MIYRKLGTTDLVSSIIGLGTWQFSGEWGKKFTKEKVYKILDTATPLGINFIDTAECYGDHLSEKLIGSFLKKRRNRQNLILATKFGHKYKRFLDVEDRWSPKNVRKQLDDSLGSLCTDYIDVYQFHSGDNIVFDNDKLWEMLNKEKRKGKIRYLGLSIYDDLVLKGDLSQIYKAKEYGIDIVQIRYNFLQREAEKIFIPEAAKLKLAILVRQPLAYGYLAGKYSRHSQFPQNDVRHWIDKVFLSEGFRQIERLNTSLGNSHNLAKLAIVLCLKNEKVDTVIVGCKSVTQIKESIEAIKIYAKIKDKTI